MSKIKPIHQTSSWFLIVIYIFLCLLFFSEFSGPSMKTGTPRIGADSSIYIEYVESYLRGSTILESLDTIITLGSNFLGPVLILQLTGSNLFLVSSINCFIFLLAYILILKSYNINQFKFSILLLINPMLLVSLTTVNKEIIGLFSVTLTLYFLKTKKSFYFIPSFIMTFLTRWHQAFVYLIVLFIRSRFNPFRNNDYLSIISFIAFTTVFAAYQSGLISEILITDSLDEVEGYDYRSSILFLLNELQFKYMFFLALAPKIFINFFGNFNYGNSFNYFFSFLGSLKFGVYDVYNEIVVPMHQCCMLLVSIIIIKNNWLNFKISNFLNSVFLKRNMIDDDALFCTIYSIFYALSTFIQSRYFFPIFIILCVKASLLPEHDDKYSTPTASKSKLQ
jgi:hypothetical protein